MFAYTVYGAYSNAARTRTRLRTEAVASVESTRPAMRSWEEQWNNYGQPQQTLDVQLASRAYLQSLRPTQPAHAPSETAATNAVPHAETQPRIGELHLQGVAPLVAEFRRPQPILAPDFSGYTEKLHAFLLERDIRSSTSMGAAAET